MTTSPESAAPVETSPQKKVSRTVLLFVAIALIIGVVASALFFSNPKLLMLGALIFVPYAFLLMAPVLLARSTHAADEATKAADEAQGTSSKAE